MEQQPTYEESLQQLQQRIQELPKFWQRALAFACAVILVIVIETDSQRIRHNDSLGDPQPGCTPADKSFEYFELVLQWPPAFGTSVGNQIPYWTIHGLWPSRLKNYKTYPCTCTNEAFNEGAISSLTGEMKYYWPTLSQSNSNSWFWSHEWEKHGTCSSPYISSQFNYFDTTLKLRKQIDPAKLLGNLVPSKTPYPFNLVYEVLSKSGSVIMHCKNPGTPSQSLVEINICMTASKTPTQFGCPAVLRDQSGLCDPAFPVTIRPPSVPSRG